MYSTGTNTNTKLKYCTKTTLIDTWEYTCCDLYKPEPVTCEHSSLTFSLPLTFPDRLTAPDEEEERDKEVAECILRERERET